MASMNYVGLDDMAWFSAADADCWGLTRWPPGTKRVVITTCRRSTQITPPPHLGPADLADYVEASTIAVQANPARTIGNRPSNPGALFADLAAVQLDG
jgi:hypothetical protein